MNLPMIPKLCLLIVLLPTVALADESDLRLARLLARADETTVAVARVPLTPLQREIKAVVDSAQAAEVHLLQKLGTTATADHPAVTHLRQRTTLRVLEIQARHAAAAGQEGLERRIRANLAVLRDRIGAAHPGEDPVGRRAG